MKIVLDTNVLISAIVFGGKPRKIFEALLSGKWDLAFSSFLLEELQGVLEGPKFRYTKDVVQTILGELIGMGELIYPTQLLNVIKRDPDDNRVLECALEAGASVIVSGDDDLLELKKFQNILILSPSQFLENF